MTASLGGCTRHVPPQVLFCGNIVGYQYDDLKLGTPEMDGFQDDPDAADEHLHHIKVSYVIGTGSRDTGQCDVALNGDRLTLIGVKYGRSYDHKDGQKVVVAPGTDLLTGNWARWRVNGYEEIAPQPAAPGYSKAEN